MYKKCENCYKDGKVPNEESCKKCEDDIKRKEQSEEKLVKQIQTICDFINNRPETFKGINGSVDKIITDYAKAKEEKLNKIEDVCDDILENYMKHSLACVDLAGKITDIINDVKQEVE